MMAGTNRGRDAARPGARARGYDQRWQKAAATFKRRHPLCLGCAAVGKCVPTGLVDHVEPHKGDQAKFWNTAMWQPSCKHHHDVVKKQLENLFGQGAIGTDQLWLNSETAIAITRKNPAKQSVGADGWPETQGGE